MRETVDSLRERTGRTALALKGMVRRLVTGLTEGAAWQLLGYLDAAGVRESVNAESFQHVGFGSRPAGQAEVVVVHVGGEAECPIIVATRDRSTQVVLEADETAIWNSKALVRITKDGDVIIRAAAGRTVSVDDGSGAQALATKADIDALGSYVHAHLHSGVSSGVGSSGPPIGSVPGAAGTLVLRGK